MQAHWSKQHLYVCGTFAARFEPDEMMYKVIGASEHFILRGRQRRPYRSEAEGTHTQEHNDRRQQADSWPCRGGWSMERVDDHEALR
jgi:hypothetical protein